MIEDLLYELKGLWGENWPRFKANKLGIIGVVILLLFLFFALFGPIYLEMMGNSYSPMSGMDTSLGINPETNSYAWPPSLKHPMGTDSKGSDIFSQFLNGSYLAFLIGISIALGAAILGVIMGLISGYWGGRWIDSLIMRSADALVSIPFLPLLIVIAAVVGSLHLFTFIMIMMVFSWIGVCRVIRAQTLSLRTRPYIDAARVAGASSSRIIFKHIAPNVIPLGFYELTMIVGAAIITESGISFLGFGDPTQMSWGMMINFCTAQGHTFKAPWWLLPPGFGITLLSMAFYLIGRAFDEIVNPRLRKME